MDAIFAKIGDLLISLGLPGIVIIGLSMAVVNLFKLNTKIQEARAEEIRTMVKAMDDSSSALRELVNVIRQKNGP